MRVTSRCAQTVHDQQRAATAAADMVQRHPLNAIPRGSRQGWFPQEKRLTNYLERFETGRRRHPGRSSNSACRHRPRENQEPLRERTAMAPARKRVLLRA